MREFWQAFQLAMGFEVARILGCLFWILVIAAIFVGCSLLVGN